MNSARRLVTCLLGIILLCAFDASAKDLERADYKMSLPEEATLDEPDDDVDADHMTTINLPNDSTMIVLIIDDKKQGPGMFTQLAENYRQKLTDGVVKPTKAFAQTKAIRSAVVSGKMEGLKFGFEVGQFDGKKKTALVVYTYVESSKAEAIATAQKWLKTFVMKN
jgi:hypothetical protein